MASLLPLDLRKAILNLYKAAGADKKKLASVQRRLNYQASGQRQISAQTLEDLATIGKLEEVKNVKERISKRAKKSASYKIIEDAEKLADIIEAGIRYAKQEWAIGRAAEGLLQGFANIVRRNYYYDLGPQESGGIIFERAYDRRPVGSIAPLTPSEFHPGGENSSAFDFVGLIWDSFLFESGEPDELIAYDSRRIQIWREDQEEKIESGDCDRIKLYRLAFIYDRREKEWEFIYQMLCYGSPGGGGRQRGGIPRVSDVQGRLPL